MPIARANPALVFFAAAVLASCAAKTKQNQVNTGGDLVEADAEVSAGADGWVPVWLDKNGCNQFEHKDKLSGKCVDNNAQIRADEKSCWDHGAVNDWGVGKPCKPGVVECTGLKANCCHVDDKRYGAICTTYCDKAGQVDEANCGPGTWCAPFHVCLPAMCQVGFTDPKKPSFVVASAKGFPCDGKVLDKGLGAKCTGAPTDCGASGGATDSYCLGLAAESTTVTSFCSRPCQADADCGSSATCVYSNGHPFFCAPTVCAGQFDAIVFPNAGADDGELDPSQLLENLPVCNKPPTK